MVNSRHDGDMNAQSSSLWKPVQRKGVKGFTLTELLTVIVVIGVLAAVLFPTLSKAKAQGQSTVCKNHLSQIGRAMEMCVSDHNKYPSAITYGGDFPPFQPWAEELRSYNSLHWTNLMQNCGLPPMNGSSKINNRRLLWREWQSARCAAAFAPEGII